MKPIEYKPILSTGSGKICLRIYPPGTWSKEKKNYVVFIGGCSVGEKETLEEAEQYLFTSTISELKYRVEEANRAANHYKKQLNIFTLRRESSET